MRSTTALHLPESGIDHPGISGGEIGCLSLAALLLLRPVAEVWATQPAYAYGWGIPVLAFYLFHQRWKTRPEGQFPRMGRWMPPVALGIWAIALAFTRLILEVVPDWRPALGCIVALDVVALAGWFWIRGGSAWLRHFGFASVFLLFAAPWPYQVETWLVQGLSRLNAVLVADSLVLADLPVSAAGSTILTLSGPLGIERACSGISSLQASVVIALFLGEFYRLAGRARGALLLLGLFMALLGNYLRLLFLAWSSEREGRANMESSHDVAGLGIFILTLAGVWLAAWLMRRPPRPQKEERIIASNSLLQGEARPARRWARGILFAALLSEGLTQAWFAGREPPPHPGWTIHLPSAMRGFRTLPIPEATHELLGDTEARAAAWRDERGRRWQVFWFRYRDQRSNRLSVELHTPEVCLPAVGQRELARFPAFSWEREGLVLPVESYLFVAAGTPRYVFWAVDRTDHLRNSKNPRNLIYQGGLPAVLTRLYLWAQDAWRGSRDWPAQSLEVTIAGAADYREAQNAFCQFLVQSIAPAPIVPRVVSAQ